MADKIPTPHPPETSVPSETLTPASSNRPTLDMPLRKLKLDLSLLLLCGTRSANDKITTPKE